MQVFNPFLPSWEYIPDGEPHVFGDRVYLYGSHDKFNGTTFCMNDYVCWSAPVKDLSDWKYEGVIWKKKDDPNYRGRGSMYAPDVCLAPDGRYYLYYAFAPSVTRKSWAIRCAVSDGPAGPFKYHGEVNLYPYSGRFLPFDPAVYVENGRVWLYYGSATFFPVLGVSKKKLKGGAVAELDPEDMLTVIVKPVQTMPIGGKADGHGFFEASSMRKLNGRYYFIYSSVNGHELCYAVGDKPDGPFKYGGVIVSIGDVGISEKPLNYLGNTHGSIERLNGAYYAFYHRQTNNHCFSRQACAERITIEDDGSIKQVEVTSCGLNGAPLKAEGSYGAGIACNLFSKKGVKFYKLKTPRGRHPYFTQSGKDRECDGDQYIANFCDGATAGFKYFSFDGNGKISVVLRGKASGEMIVKDGLQGDICARIPVRSGKAEGVFSSPLKISDGVKPLYFTFKGKGRPDFIGIIFG